MGLLLAAIFSILSTHTPQISSGTLPWNLGVKFRSSLSGRITSVKYFRIAGDPGPHTGQVWSSTGQKLAEVTFVNESASGWQEQVLPTPISIISGIIYTVSVTNPAGAHYALTSGEFTTDLIDGPITYLASGGSYGPIGAFPTNSTPTSYYRDFVFTPDLVTTITITPNSSVPGGFFVTLTNFMPGRYAIGVSMKDDKGVTTVGNSTITLPVVETQQGGPQ